MDEPDKWEDGGATDWTGGGPEQAKLGKAQSLSCPPDPQAERHLDIDAWRSGQRSVQEIETREMSAKDYYESLRSLPMKGSSPAPHCWALTPASLPTTSWAKGVLHNGSF